MSSMGNEKVRLHMNGEMTPFRFTMPQRSIAGIKISRGSALQRPDVSRAKLAAALRKLSRINERKEPKSTWTAFLIHTMSYAANSNQQ